MEIPIRDSQELKCPSGAVQLMGHLDFDFSVPCLFINFSKRAQVSTTPAMSASLCLSNTRIKKEANDSLTSFEDVTDWRRNYLLTMNRIV